MYVKDAENTAVCSMNVQDTDNTDQMVPSMVDINIEYNFVDDMESGSPTAIESENETVIINAVNSTFEQFKAHRQISKKQCLKKYCSCGKAWQFSALQGTPCRSYLENPITDDKFINKRVRLFIHQTCLKRVEKRKSLGRHNNYICKITV